MAIANGTRDAFDNLKAKAPDEFPELPEDNDARRHVFETRFGRRGDITDGGKTGRLVLLGENGAEIAEVPWTTTGERVPPVRRLD